MTRNSLCIQVPRTRGDDITDEGAHYYKTLIVSAQNGFFKSNNIICQKISLLLNINTCKSDIVAEKLADLNLAPREICWLLLKCEINLLLYGKQILQATQWFV